MKLQIVSKLARKGQQNKQNSLSYSVLMLEAYNQEYYPQKYKKKPTNQEPNHITYKNQQFAQFFDHFQQNCIVSYSKREEKSDTFKRKLQYQLIALQNNQNSSHKKPEIEFSFKKGNSISSNEKNTSLQTQASETQTKNKQLYMRACSKGKLRKFNSLITLKEDSQTNIAPLLNRPALRKNASNYKQSYLQNQKAGFISQSNRYSYNPNTFCAKVENLEPRASILSQYDNKTQRCGEDIRERLGKIRKELNMIYEENKQPQFKLKLF